MNKLNIGIDVDGVIYPFIEEFKKYCEKHYSCSLEEPTSWHVWDSWGITKNEFEELHRQFILNDGLEIGTPEKDSVKYINKLLEDGHNVFIVTHRVFEDWDIQIKTKSVSSTVKWLESSGFNYSGILFLKEKNLMKLDFLLDDAIHNLSDCENSVCFDRPWNQDWQGDRIYSWKEFYHDIVYELFYSPAFNLNKK